MTDIKVEDADITSLLERVEKATGPDRDLDIEIWRSLAGGEEAYAAGRWPLPWLYRYTDNIDACVVLARHHLGAATMWSVCEMEEGPYAQLIVPMPNGDYIGGHVGSYGNSAQLAILAALLKALRSLSQGAGHEQ